MQSVYYLCCTLKEKFMASNRFSIYAILQITGIAILILSIQPIRAQYPSYDLIAQQHKELIEKYHENNQTIKKQFLKTAPNRQTTTELIQLVHTFRNPGDSTWVLPGVDELLHRLEGLSKKERVDATEALCYYFNEARKKEVAKKIMEPELATVIKENNYEAIARLYLCKSYFYHSTGIDSIYHNLDLAIYNARRANNRCILAYSKYRKGVILRATGYYSAAENTLLSIGDSCENCPDHCGGLNHYRLKYQIGLNYFLLGKYGESLKWFEKTLNEDSQELWISDFWNIYEIMGNIYTLIEDYERAEELHHRVLYLRRLRSKIENNEVEQKGIAYSYNNLAEIYLNTNRLDSALHYALESYRIKTNPKARCSDYDRSTSTQNIAECYLIMGMTDSARYYNNLTYQWISNRINNFASSRYYRQLAEIEWAENRLQEALIASEQAVKSAKEKESADELRKALKVRAKVLESAGKHKEALTHYQEFLAIHDSLVSTINHSKVAALQIAHDSERSKQLIAYQEDKLDLSKKNSQMMMISFLIILSTASVAVFNILGNKKRKYQILEKNHQLLRQENQLITLEKTIIEKELEQKNSKLICHIRNITEKENLMRKMTLALKKSDEEKMRKYPALVDEIAQSISGEGWKEFEMLMQNTHPEFMTQLFKHHSNLTPKEWKLCAMLQLNLTTKQIAEIMHIEPASVDVARSRLRKKLNLSRDTNLTEYLATLALAK